MSYPEICDICPRRCGADRTNSHGFCGGGKNIRISKTMVHKWEEPCICGKDGTGAVFFAGCSLKCVFCQNMPVSIGNRGDEYTIDELANLISGISMSGVCTIDLVTPSHYAPQIKEALLISRPNIPVVYNLGGYELADSVAGYMDTADIFLTDFKYGSSESADMYSDAPDYPEIASEAIAEMYRIVGDPVIGDGGIMHRGIILRHLVLPGERHDSVKALELAAKAVPPEKMILSLMRQYTPGFASPGIGKLHRRVTTFEYEYVLDAAVSMGFSGYFQSAESASAKFTPDF